MSGTLNAVRRAKNRQKTRAMDAMVVGAGIGGLYQLHQLRELGLNVRAYDTASDVGGTWYWNRYPGAKLDSEAYAYQYLFSEELYKGWSWTARYATQPEVERWLHYVADKLALRRDIQLSTRITQAIYDEDRKRWSVYTDDGEIVDAQFLITCCGMLSAPMSNLFAGQESFEGQIFHTSHWPAEPIELAGMRVGVVGIGASGIGVMQAIAETVGKLKVFVRNPQYVLPMVNYEYGQKEVEAYKSRFVELRNTMPYTFSGFDYDYEYTWAELSDEQRRHVLEECYNSGSLRLWLASFSDMLTDKDANDAISEFVREKMRGCLKDPKLWDALIPKHYGFGTVRVPLESNILDIYQRHNVEVVSVKENPIVNVVPEGIVLADGTVYELDVVILATGFDAGSGALTRIDIQGRGGRKLQDEWSREIRTMMGLQVHGYPNMFTVGAPLAPSAAFCNVPTCLQQQTEWITRCIRFMQRENYAVVEPSKQAQDGWVKQHDEATSTSMLSRTDSWYTGSNVPGKPRRVIAYTGGVGTYRKLCDEIAEKRYEGFEMR